MSATTYFKEEEFTSLVTELSEKYTLEEYEAKDAINKAISKIYGFERVSISKEGAIVGIISNKNSAVYELKHYNVSKTKYKEFLDVLDNELYLKSIEKIQSKFQDIIKNSKNIVYGKLKEKKEKTLIFDNAKECISTIVINYNMKLDILSEIVDRYEKVMKIEEEINSNIFLTNVRNKVFTNQVVEEMERLYGIIDLNKKQCDEWLISNRVLYSYEERYFDKK